jgi:hypothetical protein
MLQKKLSEYPEFEDITIEETLIHTKNFTMTVSQTFTSRQLKFHYWLTELNWFTDCGIEDPYFDYLSCWFCLDGDWETNWLNGEVYMRCLDCGTILD